MLKYERWSLLAGLRFFLAFIIAVNHLAEYAPLGWLAVVPRFGPFEAILGFLLVSGYSIGSSYDKQPQGFLKRRTLRIYPIYLGAIVLTFAAMPGRGTAPEILQNVFFLNQITTTWSFVGPAWSLALEFWLYCLTPWIARIPVRHLRLAIYASFVSYAVYTCGRTLFHWPYYSDVDYGLNLLLLSFVWLCGFALARSRDFLRDVAVLFSGHFALETCIQFGFRLKNARLHDFFGADILYLFQHGCTLAMIFGLFHLVVHRKLGTANSSPLRLAGDVSYPLYLVHIPVYVLAARFGIGGRYLLLAAALVVALLFFYTIDFYSKRRSRAAVLLPRAA